MSRPNIVFITGGAEPFNLASQDRRFMVVGARRSPRKPKLIGARVPGFTTDNYPIYWGRYGELGVAWWIRHHDEENERGKSVVRSEACGLLTRFLAVTDDFGSLVAVSKGETFLLETRP